MVRTRMVFRKTGKAFLVILSLFVISLTGFSQSKWNVNDSISYDQLKNEFQDPDYATWGEVPLWWWEADSLSKDRVTWELEELASKGVEAVSPIQRSPARTYPESFSKEWWEMMEYVHKECKRLGMKLWVYDQVGYGQYGWLEKAAAQVDNTGTSQVNFLTGNASEEESINLKIPEGGLLAARAYPVVNDTPRDGKSLDLFGEIDDRVLQWQPEQGNWKIAVSVAVPYRSFYLNEASTNIFIDQLYDSIEDVVGENAMGKSLAGIFQDEHPPTPRNIYSQELAESFEAKYGYPMARAIPALHFDIGPNTPKYRLNYFDNYLALVEDTYWKRIYDWTAKRGVLTSHDNWGRNNIYRQSEGYIDYFRTQRWFSATGLDDYHQRPLEERNYYDTKIASSIARLYKRPRVWAEAFHSSGWGRTTDQTLTWLSTLYAFGANLYDEHGLYYAMNASTWEHAAPDPHFRQPYWEYYQEISDWVSRTSYLMSQGSAVADVAVHYPVTSLLADVERSKIDYNQYMELSRLIYNEGMDNDIIDDGSIIEAEIKDGKLVKGSNKYQALVFGPEETLRLPVLKKAQNLAEAGGTVLFYGQLPSGSVENGKNDEAITTILEEMLGVSSLDNSSKNGTIKNNFEKGGFVGFLQHTPELLPSLLSSHINRDFVSGGKEVYVSHRSIGDIDAYLLQNTEDRPVEHKARFRVDKVPEIWDPFSGEIREVDWFERKNGYTRAKISLEGNVARLLVFRPGEKDSNTGGNRDMDWQNKTISENWEFSVIPTRDNQWGDFRWPPANEKIGPEVRKFKYKEEKGTSGTELGWQKAGIDDTDWNEYLYDTGPYWLALENIPENTSMVQKLLDDPQSIKAGNQVSINGSSYSWEEVAFSQKMGQGEPAPWGGHSGYPDGHYDKNFVRLEEGRKLLFTRIYSPEKQKAGLNVQLRNSEINLWINGEKQICEGEVCNLPLKKGYNNVLLEIPDGKRGMLYVQKDPPSLPAGGKEGTEAIYPELSNASWIWYGNTDGTYLRKSFNLEEIPESDHMVVTGVTGYKLFINGEKVHEEIGPWANWDYPENINIKQYLKEGKNTIAAWDQFYQAQHYFTDITSEYKGFALGMKAIFDDGSSLKVFTDNSWKGNTEEINNWQSPDFNHESWNNASLQRVVGDQPWGTAFLDNIGSSTTPYRPLSVSLASPYLQVFKEMPEIVYDVKPKSSARMGWYRFEVPPGIKSMKLNTEAEATVWVNGNKVPVSNNTVKVSSPPLDVAQVAVRLKMKPGQYAGAAFNLPVELKLKGGNIQPGPWHDYALSTYSGIGVYKQTVYFSEAEANQSIKLDLGEIRVAAKVLVNGEQAGVRVAEPFQYDISELIQPGKNEIEVRVANTLAPHFSNPDRALHLGPTKSGLIGPVLVKVSEE